MQLLGSSWPLESCGADAQWLIPAAHHKVSVDLVACESGVWNAERRGSQRSGARSPSLLQYQAERQARILVSSVALYSKAVRHFQLRFFYVYYMSFDTNSCSEAAYENKCCPNVVHNYTISSIQNMTTICRAKSPGVRLYEKSVERVITWWCDGAVHCEYIID